MNVPPLPLIFVEAAASSARREIELCQKQMILMSTQKNISQINLPFANLQLWPHANAPTINFQQA